MRGDLSAPVLAIIVTIGIIAAGLVLLAWFWWFAPTAGKSGSLQILGQPSLIYTKKDSNQYNYTAYIGVRNTGNDAIQIIGLTVEGVSCTDLTLETQQLILSPGGSGTLKATCTFTSQLTKYTVQGVIYTNYGTYTVNLAVIGAPS
jgi:hypothetical protein